MVLLINKAKVTSLLQVAIGVDETEFNRYIEEAQKFDLKKLLHEDFYFDLLENKDNDPWKKLIDGADYTHNNRNYSFEGLASVLAYYSYARFFLNCNNVSTSFGIVQKTNPSSTPADLQERKNVYYEKRANADDLWQDVLKYITRNRELFPSWFQQDWCERKESPKTYVIK